MTHPLAPKDPCPSPVQNIFTPPHISPNLKPSQLLSTVLDLKSTESIPKPVSKKQHKDSQYNNTAGFLL